MNYLARHKWLVHGGGGDVIIIIIIREICVLFL
jgi:hypothetical protein